MHKYHGIKQATYIKRSQKTSKKKLYGVLIRVTLASFFVALVFLGENSGISQIKQISEWTKDAVCYDITQSESYSFVQKILFGESEKV
jgi:hypothetical protein